MVGQRAGSSVDARVAYALVAAAGVLAALIVYWPTMSAGFLSDDYSHLLRVRQDGIFGLWTGAGSNFFRPVISVSLFINSTLAGLDPWSFHATNIAVHVLNAALVSALAWLLLRDRDGFISVPLVAAGAGIVFVVLSSHSEPVSWIAGRTDVVSTFFALCSLIAIVRFVQSTKAQWAAAALIACALALGSKEAVIVLPGIALAFAWHAMRRADRARSRRMMLGSAAIGATLAVVYVVVRTLSIGQLIGGYGEAHMTYSLAESIHNVALHFPGRILLPPLGKATLPVFTTTKSALILVASAAPLLMFAMRRRRRVDLGWLGVLAIAYLMSAAPAMNMYVSSIDTQGERLLYFPSVFVVIAAVGLLGFVARPRWFIAAIVAFAVMHGVWLHSASDNWREAGRIANGILSDYRRLAGPGPTSVVSLPDHVRGAYVFRSGFNAACRLFGLPSHDEGLNIHAGHGLTSESDSAAVVRSGPDVIEFIVESPTGFVEPLPPFDDSSTVLRPVSRNQLEIRFQPGTLANRRVLFASMGGLHEN